MTSKIDEASEISEVSLQGLKDTHKKELESCSKSLCVHRSTFDIKSGKDEDIFIYVRNTIPKSPVHAAADALEVAIVASAAAKTAEDSFG